MNEVLGEWTDEASLLRGYGLSGKPSEAHVHHSRTRSGGHLAFIDPWRALALRSTGVGIPWARTSRVRHAGFLQHAASRDGASGNRVYRPAAGIIPMVLIHVSASAGQRVIGFDVGLSPNAWPPWAYRCISTGAPAFFSAVK